jgi:capsular exopolysaccharide synthesis family protein
VGYIYEALQRIEEERKAAQNSVPASSGEGFAVADVVGGPELLRALRELDPSPAPAIAPEEPVTPERPGFQSIDVNNLPESCRLVTMTDPSGLGAEKFRVLATRLKNMQQKRQLKRILITSSIVQEGKSLVSSNLAITLARHELQRVLLIDGDLRKPVMANRFGLVNRPGLSEFLAGDRPVEEFIYHLEGVGVDLIPAGMIPENPLELLQSAKLKGMLTHMSSLFDWVIIDSPPLVPVADANVWGRLADGMLLVTRQGVTERKMLEKGLKPLDNPALLGVVFNGSTDSHHHYYYYSPYGRERVRLNRKPSPSEPASQS